MVSLLVVLVLVSGPPLGDSAHDTVNEVAASSSGGEDGGLDVSRLPFTPESIKMVVFSFQPRIQACYEDHLAQQKQKRAPQGTLKTRFTITPDGYVKGAKIIKNASSLKDAHLHECVVAVLSAMAFPKPPNGRSQPIDFPFNLKVER